MNILYFDDECILCNGFAKMIARLDRQDNIKFASVKELKEVMPEDFDTVAYYSDSLYIFSDAAIEAVADATGLRFIRLARIMPKPMRNAIYNFVARNRHRLSKGETCKIDQIDPEVRKKMVSS